MDFYPVKKITTAEVRINHHHHSHIDSKRSGEAEPPLNNLKREGDEKYMQTYFLWIRPPECHHHFSVATLVGVLKRATQKRKFIRDERSVDRLEAKDRETSRSDSQASEAPSKIVNPQQSVAGRLMHSLSGECLTFTWYM